MWVVSLLHRHQTKFQTNFRKKRCAANQQRLVLKKHLNVFNAMMQNDGPINVNVTWIVTVSMKVSQEALQRIFNNASHRLSLKKKKKSFSAYISTVIVQTHLWSCCSTSCINTCFCFFSKANRGLRFECADLYLCEYVNLLKRQNTPIHSGGHVLMKNSYVISEKTELNSHRQYSLITQVWLTVNDSPETLKLCSYLIMF